MTTRSMCADEQDKGEEPGELVSLWTWTLCVLFLPRLLACQRC